ncbi:phosphonate ABC transporter ATP-binding protein [Bacteroidetes bacterium UKL13-3]|jgi:cell division transport system ATP-binding protein|nr:phosphonate ABC transporter ATP-binding protein [Bacteroidetes bacterium UKL13-3]HCP92798.1 phosphonate ABC transporter ATP-binding protein [Bacteroidota bacterium]
MEQKTVIELIDVQVFQGKNLILSDVDINIKQGEFVYLIGQTGSGKSSLLKTLYGEVPLIKGQGTIAEVNLKELKATQVPFLRRKLGIVFQDFQLLTDRTVYKNLEFVLDATGWKNESDKKKRIDEVLELVNLSTKDFKMPHELSGGEQQRVVIARALLNHPEIILADEPTGNLDPKVSDDIMNLLIHISKTGTAILMATHDYRIIQKFPGKILRCENGIVGEVASVPTF